MVVEMDVRVAIRCFFFTGVSQPCVFDIFSEASNQSYEEKKEKSKGRKYRWRRRENIYAQ